MLRIFCLFSPQLRCLLVVTKCLLQLRVAIFRNIVLQTCAMPHVRSTSRKLRTIQPTSIRSEHLDCTKSETMEHESTPPLCQENKECEKNAQHQHHIIFVNMTEALDIYLQTCYTTLNHTVTTTFTPAFLFPKSISNTAQNLLPISAANRAIFVLLARTPNPWKSVGAHQIFLPYDCHGHALLTCLPQALAVPLTPPAREAVPVLLGIAPSEGGSGRRFGIWMQAIWPSAP